MISFLCLFILFVAAAFHFYWALGGCVGLSVSVPQRLDGQPIFVPSPLATVAVGLAIAGIILVVLANESIIPSILPYQWNRDLIALFAFAFIARALSWHKYFGFFKTVRSTKFARYDTWFYSPLCLLNGLGLLYLFLYP